MGTDDFFKKKKAKLKDRQSGTREQYPHSYLIVSEGTNTERLYFQGIADYIKEKYDIASIRNQVPTIKALGKGLGTVHLVEAAAELAKKEHRFEHVWVIFDKDEFPDFDEAIELAKEKRFHVGWSNQCFEYWLYLHFSYCDSALHRDEWVKKLDEIFKSFGLAEGYTKTNCDLFTIMSTYGSIRQAIYNAKKQRMNYDINDKPSLCDPCTTVYLLLNELEPYINDLIKNP